MLSTLAIANYRSLRELVLPLAPLTVITGANGTGKSSVYRALRLLAHTAQGGVVRALSQEGGIQSTLWAGPETLSRAMRSGDVPVRGTVRQAPVSLRLGFAGADFGYAIDLGFPAPVPRTLFAHDPQIKREAIWAGAVYRPASALIERHNHVVKVHDGRSWHVLAREAPLFDSLFTFCADPTRAPEALRLRETMRQWRFYDHWRTDADAPARRDHIGTHTPVLADDGADLAAALQTIIEIGDADALAHAIDDAFPGTTLQIVPADGRLILEIRQPGMLRALRAAELSDGTLRYLLLTAALLSPRPPALLVLNEPETSLHPDLLPALGRLIAQVAETTQVIVVTHAQRLVATLSRTPDALLHTLEKTLGATELLGADPLTRPPWQWPAR
ncbi:AAA family ATPase [Chitinibacteraceae bacterium HSL-7]